MAYKIIALVCLVAVVCASPAPTLIAGGSGGLLGNLLGGAGGLVTGVLDGVGGLVNGLLGGPAEIDGKVNLGLNLGGFLNHLGGLLGGVAGDAGSILKDLSKLKIPGTLDDVFNLVIGVGASLGGILNAVLPGAGTEVGNLVIGLSKVLICGLGSPGLTGNLLGDRRPGYNNPSDIPDICSPKFGAKFGLKSYDGDYSIDDICDFYGLGQIDDQLRDLLNKKTNGQGLDGLSGSQYWITKWILDLSSLVKSRRSSGKWTNDDAITIIITIPKILGGVGNGYRRDYGTRLCNQYFRYLRASTKKNSHFKNFNWDKYEKQVISDVSKCNKFDDFNGVWDKNNKKSYDEVTNDQNTEYSYTSNEESNNNSSEQNNYEERSSNSGSNGQSGQAESQQQQVNEQQTNEAQSNQQSGEQNSNQQQTTEGQSANNQEWSNDSQSGGSNSYDKSGSTEENARSDESSGSNAEENSYESGNFGSQDQTKSGSYTKSSNKKISSSSSKSTISQQKKISSQVRTGSTGYQQIYEN